MSKAQRWLVGFLFDCYILLCSITIVNTSGTCDEIAHHIASGYSFLKTRDFRLNPSAPPLIREIMALPFLITRPKLPLEQKSWQELDTPAFSKQFFYVYNHNADFLIYTARFMILALGVLLGLIVYHCSKNMYGKGGGVFSLLLYCFCPNIIAHSSLATLDLGFSLFFVLSIWCFLDFLKKPNLINTSLATLTFGLAQAAKFTSLLLYPLYTAAVFLCRFILKDGQNKKRILGLLCIFTLSLLVIWTAYFFECKPFLKNVANIEEKRFFAQRLLTGLLPIPLIDKILFCVPLPFTTHLMGMLGVFKHAGQGHLTFFLGSWNTFGCRFYYLLAFLIKTPIALLILILWLFIVIMRKKKISFDETFLVATIVVLFSVASLSTLQLGLRYILPVYPLFFILLGKIFKEYGCGKGRLSFLTFIVLWYIFSSLAIVPHSLSYFNEFIGGPRNGYRFLRDSNLDWGQDLKSLSALLKRLPVKRIKLCYFGEAAPEYYGIIYEKTTPADTTSPQPNTYYAISVQYLDSFAWTRYTKPIARAGYSILIYETEVKRRHKLL